MDREHLEAALWSIWPDAHPSQIDLALGAADSYALTSRDGGGVAINARARAYAPIITTRPARQAAQEIGVHERTVTKWRAALRTDPYAGQHRAELLAALVGTTHEGAA